MAWYHRLKNVLRADHLSRDLDREMAFHLAERADELRERGLSAEEAAREAGRRFGNPVLQKERMHDVDVLTWLESLLADIRYAVRGLAARPGFVVVAVVSLALGVGANTAIFSLTDALILKSLPVRHPEQLLDVDMGSPDNNYFTNPLWESIRDEVRAFSGVFAYAHTRFNLASTGEVRYVDGAWVSGAFFSTLGIRPEAGRLPGPSDDVHGCAGVAAVSDGFANREYGSPGAAIGKVVSLGGHPIPIVGVTDPAFFGVEVGRSLDIYAPLCTAATIVGPRMLESRSMWYLEIMGRPRPGLGPDQVRAALGAAAPGIFRATLPTDWGVRDKAEYLATKLDVQPAATGLSMLRDRYARALYVLMVVVGVVLFIACANIANLLLARGAARRHEISIRLAIGVGRGRLLRQLLTESLLLALLGAGLGVLFARWAGRLLVGFISTPDNGVWLDLGLDGRVLGFTAAVAVGTVVLFGLLPAWRATRVDPQLAMKASGRGIVDGDARHRLGRILVIGQVALSLALVAAAGLLLGTFRKLVTIDPGFESAGVLVAGMDFTHAVKDPAHTLVLQREMLRDLRETPGVEAAAASFITPVSHMTWNELIEIPGYTPSGPKDAMAFFNQVSDGYFATLRTPLLVGRDVAPTDGPDSPPVAVINEAMAHKFFGTTNPVGHVFHTRVGDSVSAPIQIVGVVATAKYATLTEAARPTAYIPFGQGDGAGAAINYDVRAGGPPASLIPAVKAVAARVDPRIALEFTTLDDQISASLARPRLLATLSGFFGALAMLLAVIGLYGTMSYTVARRRNEIGIRMALGAAAPRVLRMVVGEAGLLVAAGVLGGLVLALASTRYVASFLFGLSPTDPATLAASAAALGAVAMAAALLPAWRAARIDPMDALREE
jgi:putative ABC transport system permease protein